MDYITDACPASSTNMWRRPAWTNTNLFTIWGLRNYGHVPGAIEAANRLQHQTVEMVATNYEKWGTTFEFVREGFVFAASLVYSDVIQCLRMQYDSNGKVEPPFLERKSHPSSGGVRDYHWTAANVFYLLHNTNASLP